MLRSLLSGVSGLRAHQLQIDVIGNNIANINTVGFKSSRVTFQELLAQTLRGASSPSGTGGGTNPMQVGLGTSVGSVDSVWGQGQLLTTGRNTDLAIEGDGFFLLAAGDLTGYSRAGSFSLGSDGRLVAANGYVLQGYMADADGTVPAGATVSDITLPLGRVSPARATTQISLEGNLDSRDNPVGTTTQSRKLMANATGTDQVTRLFNAQGLPASLGEGSVLDLVANASAQTLVTNLSNGDEASLGLTDGMTITVRDGTATGSIIFDQAWTWQDLADQIETTLAAMGTETDITVDVNPDGSLRFTNPSGGTGANLTVTVQAASAPEFNKLINNLSVSADGVPVDSQRAYYRASLTEGSDFQTLNDLAVDVQVHLQRLGSSVSVNLIDGTLVLSNAGPGDIVGLSIVSESGTSGDFERILRFSTEATADVPAGTTVTSGRFLDLATDADLLVNLRNSAGASLGLASGSLIEVHGQVGDSSLVPVLLQVTDTGDGTEADRQAQTLGGLAEELKDIFGIGASGSVSVNDEGFLEIQGNPGTAQALTDVHLVTDTPNPTFASAFRFAQTADGAARDVQHSTSLAVYDSLGNSHVVTLTFTKVPDVPNQWTWEAAVPEGATVLSGGEGVVTFREDGTLLSFFSSDGNPFRFDPGTGASGAVEVEIQPGTLANPDGLTQFASDSSASIVAQNGHTMGFLDLFDIGPDGSISGVFTNGVSQKLAQIVLVEFNNPGGLARTRDGIFALTGASGTPVLTTPGVGRTATITSGALEASNVDLAGELVSMIVAQRGFQANTRTISTSEEMLADVINMKR